MAFSIGYVGVCDRNIQHLYTTRSIRQPARRKPRSYKPEFLKEFDAERVLRYKNRPFMEYDAKHDIELPKAPAFRNIPSTEVDNIVRRLTMPPKERFQFKYTDHFAYNDWRSARAEKIQRLRETLRKFGDSKGSHIEHVEVPKKKKTKKNKLGTEHQDDKTLPSL